MSGARWRALGVLDLAQVMRDPMLRWLLVLPFAMIPVPRWGFPLVRAALLRELDFDLAPYAPLLAAFLAVQMPVIAGTVVGFLLLDQRDDGTLTALRVTPLSLRGFLLYRLAWPTLVGAAASVLVVVGTDLVPVGAAQVVATAFAAAPLTALYALFLASFAANKVQGFALAKAVGVVLIPAVGSWFVTGPWQYAFGAVPHFWPMKQLWMMDGPGSPWLLHGLAGLTVSAVLGRLLLRRFEAVVGRD